MPRRFACSVAALSLSLLLSACGGGDEAGTDPLLEEPSVVVPEETASETLSVTPTDTPSEVPTETPSESATPAPSPNETEFFALLDTVVKDFSRFERGLRRAIADDDLGAVRAVIREVRTGFFEFDAALRDFELMPEQQPALNTLLEAIGSVIADLDAAGEERSVQAVEAAINDIDVQEFTDAFTEFAAVIG